MCWCLWLIHMRHDWLKWVEDRETPRMHKYGESKTTWIMMATEHHITAWTGRTKYQTLDFCWTECTNNNNKNLNAISEVSNYNNTKIKEILFFGALTRRRCKRVSINFAMSLCRSVLYCSRIVSVLRFSQWCGWRISTSGMWHCVTAYLVPDVTRQYSGITFKGLTIHKKILQTFKMRTLWSNEPDHAELKQGLHLQIVMWRRKKEKGMTKVNWHNLFFNGLCPLSTF
jgi:hypothetical protein